MWANFSTFVWGGVGGGIPVMITGTINLFRFMLVLIIILAITKSRKVSGKYSLLSYFLAKPEMWCGVGLKWLCFFSVDCSWRRKAIAMLFCEHRTFENYRSHLYKYLSMFPTMPLLSLSRVWNIFIRSTILTQQDYHKLPSVSSVYRYSAQCRVLRLLWSRPLTAMPQSS